MPTESVLLGFSQESTITGSSGIANKDFPRYTGIDPSLTISYSEGYIFDNSLSPYEKRNFHEPQPMDVCFCDENCDGQPENWFKVGQVLFSGYRMVSALSETATAQPDASLQYVNWPGVVAFERKTAQHNVMGLSEGGIIKILSEDSRAVTDALCQTETYDSTLIESASGLTQSSAYSAYRGTAADSDTRLVFNAGDQTNKITVKRAGVVAICYCQFANQNGCLRNEYFVVINPRGVSSRSSPELLGGMF